MKRFFLLFTILFFIPIIIFCQIPQTISYQGLLTDNAGNPAANGNYNVLFRLYEVETDGAPIWEEGKVIATSGGVFNTLLGDVTALNLPFDKVYYLGIKVGADPELTPRTTLSSVPYSYNSMNVADGAVTSEKLADNSVITDRIADGAVTQDKLNASVSLPLGGAAGGDLIGTYPDPSIANDIIKSAHIQNETILNEDINTLAAIASSKIFGDVGIEFTTLTDYIDVSTSVSSMGSVTISAPTSGYLLVLFTGSAIFFGDETVLLYGVNTNPTSLSLVQNHIGKLDGVATDRYYHSFTSMWAGGCLAGDITFYANVQKSPTFDSHTISVVEAKLVVIFIPKKY